MFRARGGWQTSLHGFDRLCWHRKQCTGWFQRWRTYKAMYFWHKLVRWFIIGGMPQTPLVAQLRGINGRQNRLQTRKARQRCLSLWDNTTKKNEWKIYSLSLALTLTVTLSPNHLITSNFGWPCSFEKAARQNPEQKAWVWGWVVLEGKCICSPYYVFHRFIMQKLGRLPTYACLLCALTYSSQVVLAYIATLCTQNCKK